jgi:hypothetical protein
LQEQRILKNSSFLSAVEHLIQAIPFFTVNMNAVPQHQVKKRPSTANLTVPTQLASLSNTGFYTRESWLRAVTLVSNNASSMCEPSVVGPDPLLHQSTPLSGNKQSKPKSFVIH